MTLLERDGDLRALVAPLARARDGCGGMVLVTGEAGAGKTTLLRTFVDGDPDGVPVLWGSCDPLSTPRPLGPLYDVANHFGDATRAVLSDGRQAHEIFDAVFEHLREHPSILVVDDLHWADQGTIDLLRFLLRRIRATRSLVVGAARDDEVGVTHPLRSLLGDVARSPDACSITLGPLSNDAITALIGDRPIDPRWLRRVTGGNPFYVVEMLGHEGGNLPRTVRDAILARTADLDAVAWNLLHLLACAPEAVPDRLLPHLGVGLSPLRALDDAGLIRRGPRGVDFRHDLCRTVIAETLPPGGEVPLHRRMLDALDAAGASDPAVLVHHAVGARLAERVARHATAAGRTAANAAAHTQAADFFRLALEQGAPLAPVDQADLLERLATECYLLDRLDEAIDACERAMRLRARTEDSAGVSANHQAMSVYHWYGANRRLAEHHADEAVAVLARKSGTLSDAEHTLLGHAFAGQAYLALQMNDLARARALIDRAAATPADRDPSLAVRVGIIRGISDLLDTGTIGRERTLSVIGSFAEHCDEIRSSGYSNLTYLDVEQRRLDQAGELLGFTIPLTVERDLPICRVWQLGSRGRLGMLRGDWDEAIADAEAVLGGPSAPLARTWPHLVRALVTLRRGGDADADLDEAWLLANRLGEPMRIFPAAAALAERTWLTGLDDDRIGACHELLRGSTQPGLDWARGELALWLHRLDPDVHADGVAEPFRLQLAGDHAAAADHWARLAAPYERALALVATGDAELARIGLDLLDRLGADAVAARIRRDLRSAGIAVVPGRRRTTTRANAAGLTDRQVEVLRLLGDGLTDAELAERLYISAKTAGHHVSAILSKLQVTNRRDAVRTGRDLGLVE